MIGGYDCTSCKSGGAKKKGAPVKRRKGGNSGNELFNAFNSAVASIKMAGGAKRKKKRMKDAPGRNSSKGKALPPK